MMLAERIFSWWTLSVGPGLLASPILTFDLDVSRQPPWARRGYRCQRAPIPSPVQSLELIRSFLRHKDAVRQVRAKLFFCLAWVFGEELVENGVGITVTISGLQSRRKRPDDKPVDEAEARANLPSEFPWVLS